MYKNLLTAGTRSQVICSGSWTGSFCLGFKLGGAELGRKSFFGTTAGRCGLSYIHTVHNSQNVAEVK